MEYAIVFAPNAPEQLLQLFDGYLARPAEANLVFAYSKIADVEGPFLSCVLEHQEESATLKVRIPIPFVFSILECPDAKRGIGFLAARN